MIRLLPLIEEDLLNTDTQHDPSSVPGNCEDGQVNSQLNCTDKHRQLSASELIQRHQKGVWRYLRMLGCDSSTADDLTQETFLRVLRRDEFVQHSEAATSSYLRRTAYNALVSMHRKTSRVHLTPDSNSIDEVWNRWAGKDLTGDITVDILRECLSKISERSQKALQMRFGEGSSRLEIADALKITDHGARNLMQRAKEKLRNCVQSGLAKREAEAEQLADFTETQQ